MRRILILGSTGSIGRNTIRVIESLPERFQVVGLSAYSDTQTLLRQVDSLRPRYICLVDESSARRAKKSLSSSCYVFSGQKGLIDLIHKSKADTVVLAISGSSALLPLLEVIASRKTVILANKEALVIAGAIIMREIKKRQIRILPVDSEQSAIWQCLEGKNRGQIRKIYLTASGGPFKGYNYRQLKNISVQDVLSHPCWRMGRRITVDSATLMNKGLEIIEAMWLFDLELSQIEVIIHPEAIVHSMVEFHDGIILAQLSITDMRIPIQYALTYPQHLKNTLRPLNFFKLKNIHFQRPNVRMFPCLRLAISAAKQGGTMPCVLNAADEIVVGAFLNNRINFTDIPRVIASVMESHKSISDPSLDEILHTDNWARVRTEEIIRGY